MITNDEFWSISNLGHELLQMGRTDEARVIFEGLTVTNPEAAYPWHALGMIAHLAGQTQASVQCLKHAVGLGAGAEASLSLAIGLCDIGKFPEAQAVLTSLVTHPELTVRGRAKLLMRRVQNR